jgi:hypothetical protein
MAKKPGIYDHGGYTGTGNDNGGAGAGGPETNAETDIDVWKEFYADDGSVYYFNDVSGESSWDIPSADNVHILQQYQDTTDQQWYWFNTTTSESIPM